MKSKRIYFNDKLWENHENHTFFQKQVAKLLFPLWTVHVDIARQSFPYAFIIKLCFLEAHSILLYYSHNHICQDPSPHICWNLCTWLTISLFITISAITLGYFKSHMDKLIPSPGLSVSLSPHHPWPSLWSSPFPDEHRAFPSLISPNINIGILRILLSDHY